MNYDGDPGESCPCFSNLCSFLRNLSRQILCLFVQISFSFLPFLHDLFSLGCLSVFHFKFLAFLLPPDFLSQITIVCVSVCVQSLNCVRFFLTPWTAARQASLSFMISQSLFRLMSIELVIPSNHSQWPLSPPALNLSQNQCLIQRVGSLHHVVKVLELQFQHQPFQ